MALINPEKRRWFYTVFIKDVDLLCWTLFLGLLSAIFGLAISVFSQKLIDEIIPSHNLTYLTIGLGIATCLALIKIGISFIQQYLGLIHSKVFNLSLIDKYFNHLLQLPKSFFDEQKTGGLISRMNDSASIQQTVSYLANGLIMHIITLIVSCSVLFYYSITIGIIALLSFPLFLSIAILFKEKLATKSREAMVANAQKESNYISTIQNIDLIKTHNKHTMFSRMNYATYGEFQDRQFVLGKTGLTLGIMAESIGAMVYMVMLSYASYQVLTGGLTIGEFSATLGIATGMLGPIGALGMALLHLQGANIAFDRMYEFISLEPEFNVDEDKSKEVVEKINTIEFKNVAFSYSKENSLIKNLNFSIKSGEIVSIFGKNGCGKSTLLNLIMSLHKCQSGEILFNGIESTKLSIANVRDKIAVVAQQSKLFDRSVIENICFDFENPDKVAIIDYLNTLGFGEYIMHMQNGYETVINENGQNLSGGQKQIISLARAMCKKPDILLLDEPTASLDGDAEMLVMKILKNYVQYGMVIMVTHKLKPARESNRILVFEGGEIGTEGNHCELLLSNNFYSQRYLELVN